MAHRFSLILQSASPSCPACGCRHCRPRLTGQKVMERLQDVKWIFDIGRALTEVQALRKVDLRAQNGRDSEKPERPETLPRKESGRTNESLPDQSD